MEQKSRAYSGGTRDRRTAFFCVLRRVILPIFISGFLLFSAFYILHSASAYTGPSGSPPAGEGAISSNAAKNVGVGTSTPSATTKLFVVASSTGSTDFGFRVVQPNGSPILVVRNDGSVGIATSTPNAATLTVQGNIYSSGAFTGTISAGNVTAGVFGAGNFAFPSSLGVATSSQVGLPQPLSVYGNAYVSGNFGIGTTSPGAKLHVVGTAGIGGAYNNYGYFIVYGNPGIDLISGTAPAIGGDLNIGVNSAWRQSITSNWYYGGNPANDRYARTGGAAQITLTTQTLSGYEAGDIDFLTAPVGDAGNQITFSRRLTIKQNGNVGVGTTGPTHLGVVSDAKVLQIIPTVDNGHAVIRLGDGSPARGNGLYEAGAAATFSGNYWNWMSLFGRNMYVDYDGTDRLKTLNTHGSTGYQGILLRPEGVEFYAETGATTGGAIVTPTPKMTILNGGYVGIGTTTPAYNLAVQGDIYASGNITCGGSCGGGGGTPGGSTGAVQFASSTTFGGDAANFFWNGTSKRLGIGTAQPSSTLHVIGVAQLSLGSAAAPAYSFTNDSNTGIYSGTADNVNISTGGTLRFTVTTAQFTGTLPWRGQNGTAAAPALSFSGDTNTGIYGTGSDVVRIATAGVDRLTVDISGNVGIGNASPAGIFHVSSSIIYASSTTGNVGIGTTSPGALLEVGTNVAITSPRTKIIGYSDTVPLQEWGDGGAVYTRLGRSVANTMFMSQANYGGADFEFRGNYNFINQVKFPGSGIWNSSGNVGIGTTSPGNLLQINSAATPAAGQLRLTANSLGSLELFSYAAGNQQILFDADWSGSQMIARHTVAARIYESGGVLAFSGNTGLTVGNVWTPTDRVTIDLATGNVGIGTSTPAYRLDVVGGAIRAHGGFILETRTSDPGSPVTGQMWLRTDI